VSPRRIAKALAGFGAVALAALVAATVYVVHNRAAAPVAAKVAGLVPGSLLHAHNFHWTQMKAGELQWVLTARDASYAADKASLILNQPVVTMTAEDGKQVTVRAAKAVLGLDGSRVKRAHLSGGMTIRYGDFVLTTDEATFVPDDDRIEAPGMVTIEGQGLKVTGVGLSGHPKTRQFELLKQVTTEIVPRPGSAASAAKS
jgi:lipopolysaccharide export system protein LptC